MKLHEGLEEGIAEQAQESERGPVVFNMNVDRLIALSQAKSLKRIADSLNRAERKLLSTTSRTFFRTIVDGVLAYADERKKYS